MDRNKPVDDPLFWKQRLDQATLEKAIEKSVYRCSKEEWDKINDYHLSIIKLIVSDSDKVLDAGCGYGRNCSWYNPTQYTGVDFSPDFIAEANKRFPLYNFNIGNLSDLWYEDNSFDYAICTSVMIMIVQNCGWFAWEKIQNELLRVSKKGIICLEYGCGDTNTDYGTFYQIKKYNGI